MYSLYGIRFIFEDEDFRPINQDWIDNRVRTA